MRSEGDYVFVTYDGNVGATDSGFVEIYRVSDGGYVGKIVPPLNSNGRVDVSYGMEVYQRSNGEYLIFVEDDWHAKIAIFRWHPNPVGLSELGTVADTTLRRSESIPQGGDAEIIVKAESGVGAYERFGLIRFDTSTLTLPVTAASLNLTATSLGGTFKFRVSGVKETNADEAFDEATLQWNSSALTDGTDDGFINSETENLGDFRLGSTDTDVALMSQELVDFINADTNGRVTLLLSRVDNNGTVSRFASREDPANPGPRIVTAGGAEAQPISQWRFDNSPANAIAGGNAVTLRNGAAFTTSAAEGTHALNLSASTANATVGSQNLPDQFSLEAWVYLPVGASNIRTVAANSGSGGSSNGFRFFVNSYNTSNGRIVFETGNGSSSLSANSGTGIFDFGQWNHLAVVVDRPAGVSRIFHNGVDVTSSETIRTDFKANATLDLGRMTTGNWYLRGRLDDVRIYDALLEYQ